MTRTGKTEKARKPSKATRPYFAASPREDDCAFLEFEVEFEWHSGMSWQVRQRSSDSMHEAILQRHGHDPHPLRAEELLEVSTASHDYEAGQALSALNLLYTSRDGKTYPVENWFQSAKAFQTPAGTRGPYPELLDVRLAKRYANPNPERGIVDKLAGDPLFDRIQGEIRGSQMSSFVFEGAEYPLDPKSAFYDYLYVSALNQPQNAGLAEHLHRYRVFTDIMFNPGSGKRRRFNTQARSGAIFVALSRRGAFDEGMPGFRDFVEAVGYGQPQDGPSERALPVQDALPGF